MNRFLFFFLFASFLVLLQGKAHAASERLNLSQTYPVLEAESKVWIGTPTGLVQYNSTDDSYKRYTIPGEHSSQQVEYLYYNEEWLWCVLDSGLAALHIRLNEWLVFNQANGLPSDVVNGLDFQDDYVWAATDNGAARFDLLIEEWEVYDQSLGTPAGAVKDILVKDDNVWMIFENGFSEYNPQYEKWRHYKIEQDSTALISRAFFLRNELWLVTDKGLVRFDTELFTQQTFFQAFLKLDNLTELMVEDDLVWVADQENIHYYDRVSGVWREFEGNSYLNNYTLNYAYVDLSDIWVLTDQNVLVWNRTEKSWTVLDYTSGLSTSSFQSIYVNSGMAFLSNPDNIDYRLSEEDNWRKYTINIGGGRIGSAGKEILKNFFDNEEGGYIGVGKNKLSFEGSRATWVYDYELQYDSNGNAGDPATLSGERLDLKSQLSLSPMKSISGFYNNVDYSETMYGVRYRSRDNSLLREFNWGDFRRNPGDVPFGETASMFGSNIWLQTGEKTPRFKKSLVTLKASTGERRSQKTYEYYNGALKDFSVTVSDVSYARNQFYEIPGLGTLDTPENIEIYVDDVISANNTPNTLTTTTIAGITGDFDVLHATQDYYFYEKGHALRFTGYYNPNATIVIRYSLNNQTFEEILQHNDIITTAKSNFYYMKAQTIVPYSFLLEIKDASGQSQPLSQFGLDDDGDGRVDSRWIDYENGILCFPEDYPFPSEVYDSEQSLSSYRLNADFRTELSLIQLEQDNLVRGTEVVKLDGEEVEGGNDYVLDYTNGTLVFVRDGTITPVTRIEIEYEYYLSENFSQLHSASVNVSPSDNFSIQTEWVNFENEGDSTTNMLNTHMELRQKVGDFDVKFTPGVTYQAEENDLTANQIEGVVSSACIRFQSKYQNYKDDYKNIYVQQSVSGQVKEKLEMNTDVDVHKNLRLSGSWTDVTAFVDEDFTTERTDKNKSVSALFHHKTLPGYQISYWDSETEIDTSTIEKQYVQQQLEYQLPQNVLGTLPIKGLKLEGVLKNGNIQGQDIGGADQHKFLQSYFRVTANLADQFQSSVFYRKNDFTIDSDDAVKNDHVWTSERLLFNLSHEKWKFLQTNLRIENTMDSYDYPDDADQYIADVNQYTQLNFRFSPGAVWSKLSPLFFEYNMNRSLYATNITDAAKNDYILSLSPEDQDEQGYSQLLNTNYVKSEIRPNPNIYIYTLYEWNNQNTSYDASSLNTGYWRLSEKVDLKLGFKTRVSLQYKHYYNDSGYSETTAYYEPSIWVERRWTNSFQNILYASYRNMDDFENAIQDKIHKYEGRYDLIFRKKNYMKMRRVELQQSFSAGQTKTTGYNTGDYYTLGSSTSLDLYPIHSLIFRLQLDLDQTTNLINRDASYLSTGVNLKMSLKL